jgi:adenylate cyclase
MLVTVPSLWMLLEYPWDPGPGFFVPLENKTIDWRIKTQSIPEEHLKFFYITVDEESLQQFGEEPWDLSFFADAAQIAFKVGHAKTVGFDFLFSQAHQKSSLIDSKKLQESQVRLGAINLAFAPQVILGCEFTNKPLPYLQDGNQARWGNFPYSFEGKNSPSQNPYPEMPAYPLIGPNWGRCGLLDTVSAWNVVDEVPRWIPLFAETEGSSDSLSILMGMRESNQLPPDALSQDEESFILKDTNGKEVCRMPLHTRRTFWNFSLELLAAHHGLQNDSFAHNDRFLTLRDASGKSIYDIPLIERQIFLTNWLLPWGDGISQPSISIAELYKTYKDFESGSGRNYEIAEAIFKQMEGAIVIMGPATDSPLCTILNPLNGAPVPRMSLYGNIIATIHSGKYLHILTPWQETGVTFCLTFFLGLLSFLWARHRRATLFLIFSGALTYAAFAFGMFEAYGLLLPMVVPIGTALSTSFLILVLQRFQKDKEQDRLAESFRTYLPPKIVEELATQSTPPSLGGEEAIITAFLSDIQNFSIFSSKLAPQELVKLMNEYFEAMTHIVHQKGGTLDKYIGDALMAIFGAPLPMADHALKACIAACQIQHRQEELCLMWAQQGKRWPKAIHSMQTRIGLSTGSAIIGNMGSAKRFNYTMMGETVNLAARAEALGKRYGCFIVATETTVKDALRQGENCLFRPLESVLFPGKNKAIELFEVVGLKENTSDKTLECLDWYEKALMAYEKEDFTKALKYFDKSSKLEPRENYSSIKKTKNPSTYWSQRILSEQNAITAQGPTKA